VKIYRAENKIKVITESDVLFFMDFLDHTSKSNYLVGTSGLSL
jgi:hypothetical protein